MLHIPNSAEGNCLTEKEKHTLCLKSDIKTINLRITKYNSEKQSHLRRHVFVSSYGFWRNAHDQYSNPLARPLLIACKLWEHRLDFISENVWEVASITLIYSLTFSRKKELLFWLRLDLNRLTCVTRQIRGDSKFRAGRINVGRWNQRSALHLMCGAE